MLCSVFIYKSFTEDCLMQYTAQKMKFSIKDFFSKCDQIRRFLKKSLMENFIFSTVVYKATSKYT